MAGAGAALVLVVLLVQGLRRAGDPRSGVTAGVIAGPRAVVEGEVSEPGPVEVAAGASVCDLVALAGGDPEGIAEPGCQRPARPWSRVTVQDGLVTVTELTPGERFALGGALDPNVTGIEELSQVPGLSDELARRVVEERTSGGPFCSVEELQRVRGIGPRKIEWIRPFLTTDPIPAGCVPSP